MSMKSALRIILGIGIAGLLFSGYLSYRAFFHAAAAESCLPVGEPGSVLGYPPCIYGFAMYLVIVAVAATGLWTGSHERKNDARPTDRLSRIVKET